MKLSKETLQVLKNFSDINPNLVIQPGKELKTISDQNNIMSEASIGETFENEMGIYDLNEFLSAVSLIDSPDFDFRSNEVEIKGVSSSVVYRYSNPSILTAPLKKVRMQESKIEVEINDSILMALRKAASALGHSSLAIRVKDGKVTANIFDPENSSANYYSLNIDNVLSEIPAGFTADFRFLVSNLKVLPGSYKVKISDACISEWVGERVKYWIALEKDSSTSNS